MADPTLDLTVRDPTHNRYWTVPTYEDLSEDGALADIAKGDFVKVLESGNRYLCRGLNDYEFLGNATSDGEAGASENFLGGPVDLFKLLDAAVAGTATSFQMGEGLTAQGEGIAEDDSGAVVGMAGGFPTMALTTTDEVDHSLVLHFSRVVDAEPYIPANVGGLELEARLTSVSASTDRRIYLGFIDTLALGSLTPATGSTTTITLTLDDQAGLLMDSGLTDSTGWFLATNNADGAADQTAASADTGINHTADTYQTLKVKIDTAGNVTAYIDGTLVKTALLGIDPAVGLAPVLIVQALGAAVKTVNVTYLAFRTFQN